jgi:hypothetical protein
VYKSSTLYEVKGKRHPITVIGREQVSGSTLSLTLSLNGCGWLTRPPSRCVPRQRHSAPVVREAGRASGPNWTGAEKRKLFAPTGVRTTDCISQKGVAV